MLDTSFIVAYFNTRDQNHSSAVKIAKILANQNHELYITDYLFGEIVTVSLVRLKNLEKATQIGTTILEYCNLIHVDKDIFEHAWKIFSEQKLRLSFVDCTTIVVMKNQKIQKIATFDNDFNKIKGIETC
jgi:hypothetical protein